MILPWFTSILSVLVLLKPHKHFCQQGVGDFRSAFGVTYQVTSSNIKGKTIELAQASSLVQCNQMCLSEPLCKHTTFAEGNTCMLLGNDENSIKVNSELQAGVYTKFESVRTEIDEGTSDSEVCDKGYLVFNYSGVINCYASYDVEVTWKYANRACRKDGAYLARIDTEPKLRFLAKMTQGDFYYTGLRQEFNDKLRWSDGSPANIPRAIALYINISQCRPNACCVHMRKTLGIKTFIMRLDSCGKLFRYICEKQPKRK